MPSLTHYNCTGYHGLCTSVHCCHAAAVHGGCLPEVTVSGLVLNCDSPPVRGEGIQMGLAALSCET
jgi:hypothetical protein